MGPRGGISMAGPRPRDDVRVLVNRSLRLMQPPFDAKNAKGGQWAAFGRISKGSGRPQTWRATIIFLISAMALAGLSPFGQAFEQFMIVWQR